MVWQCIDIDFTETEKYDEPLSRQIILNFRPHDLTKEKYIVSVEDNHDTLVGFVRINQEGHVFLTIPFEIEITRVEQVVSIEKGGYRVKIHDGTHAITGDVNILKIHNLILESLRTVSFTPVSDRIKSLGSLDVRTQTNVTPKAEAIDSRITEISGEVSDESFTNEDRYIP